MELDPRDSLNKVLHDLTRAFAAELDFDLLIPLIVRRCRDALDAGGVSVMLLDRDRGEFYFPYNSQDNAEVSATLTGLRFPADRGIAGTVLKTGRALRVDNPGNDSRFNSSVDTSTGVATRSILAAPLVARGQTAGVIEAVNHRTGPFTDDHLTLLESLAEVIAIALTNADLFSTAKKTERALRRQVGALRVANRDFEREIIGTGAAMAQVFKLIGSVASSSIPVLIEGETGTGKELVARAIHQASDRAAAPMIAVNCAAFAEGLLESELFGHRRGAFTGATSDELGLFRAANGGVVLLDEIGEMPLPMQAKLLRVLQEGEVTPVGDIRPQKVDVRVISATNRDLAAGVAAKTFREDLFYRLAVFPIHLPPLRERREDIVMLANRFIEASSKRNSKRVEGFEPDALDALTRFDWPGNVRQLENEIARAVTLVADGEPITVTQLSAAVTGGPKLSAATETDSVLSSSEIAATGVLALADARADFEARYIAGVLAQNGGKVSPTARALGISREALHKRIKKSKC